MASSDDYDVIQALNSLHKSLWSKPESLVSQQTVQYKTVHGDTKSKTCDVFDLGGHADEVLALGFSVERQLLVPQEYQDAFQHIKGVFSTRARGVAVTGQPGIGKSLFLLYVLLRRMQEALPTAIQSFSAGYYIVDDKGASFHRGDRKPLNTPQQVWCLSDSREDARVPIYEFLYGKSARTIQAASPLHDRWSRWTKEADGELYVMDTWDEGELALLGFLRGEEEVPRILRLSSEWGPCPRHLMKALKNVPDWEKTLSRIINSAADQLAQDPERVLSSINQFAHESTASPVLWLRPKDKVDNRVDFDTYVPKASKIIEAVNRALLTRTAVEISSYFYKTSRSSCSRGLAGHLFEILTHIALMNGSQPLTWYGGNRAPNPNTVSPVTSDQVISSSRELQSARAPFYFHPALANYPGIDSALCTRTTIYAIQSTVTTDHTSALAGLEKLYKELPSSCRLTRQDWRLLFANPKEEDSQYLVELQRNAIPENSHWKGIEVGYFSPGSLHIKDSITALNQNHQIQKARGAP